MNSFAENRCYAGVDKSVMSSTFGRLNLHTFNTNLRALTDHLCGTTHRYYSAAKHDFWALASDASKSDAESNGYTLVGTLGYGLAL